MVHAIVRAVKGKVLSAENVTITRGLTLNHAFDLANREIDIAFTLDALDQTPGIDSLQIYRETYVLVLPKRLAKRQTDIAKLAHELPFLRFSARAQSAQRIETYLRRLRHKIPQSSYFEVAEDIIAAIGDGFGWSISAPSHVMASITDGVSIETRPLPRPRLNRTIGLAWRTGELNDTMDQMIAVCYEALESAIIPQLSSALPALDNHFEVLHEVNSL